MAATFSIFSFLRPVVKVCWPFSLYCDWESFGYLSNSCEFDIVMSLNYQSYYIIDIMTDRIFILVLLSSLLATSFSWSIIRQQTASAKSDTSCAQTSILTQTSTQLDDVLQTPDDDVLLNRRSFFHTTSIIAIAISSSTTISYTKAASAIEYTTEQQKALKQWNDSVATIDNLLDNWDPVSSGGGSQKEVGISGDAIRKELGTANFGKDVSPLFKIDKAFKVLRDNDDIDLVEFTELTEEFVEVLASADSQAYSANFAGK